MQLGVPTKSSFFGGFLNKKKTDKGSVINHTASKAFPVGGGGGKTNGLDYPTRSGQGSAFKHSDPQSNNSPQE